MLKFHPAVPEHFRKTINEVQQALNVSFDEVKPNKKVATVELAIQGDKKVLKYNPQFAAELLPGLQEFVDNDNAQAMYQIIHQTTFSANNPLDTLRRLARSDDATLQQIAGIYTRAIQKAEVAHAAAPMMHVQPQIGPQYSSDMERAEHIAAYSPQKTLNKADEILLKIRKSRRQGISINPEELKQMLDALVDVYDADLGKIKGESPEYWDTVVADCLQIADAERAYKLPFFFDVGTKMQALWKEFKDAFETMGDSIQKILDSGSEITVDQVNGIIGAVTLPWYNFMEANEALTKARAVRAAFQCSDYPDMINKNLLAQLPARFEYRDGVLIFDPSHILADRLAGLRRDEIANRRGKGAEE
jgi:hypothetical protein